MKPLPPGTVIRGKTFYQAPPQQYDKGCNHGNRFRFKSSERGDTVCARCVIDRLRKRNDEQFESLRRYEVLREMAPNNLAQGIKVQLWWPHWGYDGDTKQVLKLGMKIGNVFTIDHTDEHSSSTDFYLVEFPGQRFNSVHFAIHKP